MPSTPHALFSSYLSHLERKGDKDETVKRNRHALVRHGALSDLGVEPTKVTEVVIEENFAWLDGAVEQTTANREAGRRPIPRPRFSGRRARRARIPVRPDRAV